MSAGSNGGISCVSEVSVVSQERSAKHKTIKYLYMSMYQLFTNKEESYECVEPSNKAAKDYAKLMIKCAPRPVQERLELARQFGWDAKEVKDEIFYEDYQRERVLYIVSSHVRSEIKKNEGFLNIPEVDKAESFFYKSYRASYERAIAIIERTEQIPDPTAYSVSDGGCETNRYQRDRQRAVSAIYAQFEFMEALIMRASTTAHDIIVLENADPETVAKAYVAKALRG